MSAQSTIKLRKAPGLSEPEATARFRVTPTYFGLCLFTYAIVTYRTYGLPLAEVGVAIGVLGLLLQKESLRITPVVWCYGAFVCWGVISAITSPYHAIAIDNVIERAKLWVILLVAVNALRTSAQVRWYFVFFLVCFILFPARGALFNYFAGYTTFGRALWNYVYANPNDLGALSLLALGVALALGLAKEGSRVVKWGGRASVAVLLAVILLTQSRGVFLGLVIGIVLGLLPTVWQQPRRLLYVTIGILVVIVATPQVVWQRLSGISKLANVETIDQADPEGSASQRFEVQKVAWRIFLDAPVFGNGLGTYKLVNAEYSPELGLRDTHNTYLNLAAEAGLPGLVIWVGLYFYVFLTVGGRRPLAEPHLLDAQWIRRGLVGFLIASIFGTYSALTFPNLMLAALWCSGRDAEPITAPVGRRPAPVRKVR